MTDPTPQPSRPAADETAEDGHTFRFVFDIRGSSKVVGDPEHHDVPAFMGPTHVIEVRAWSLTAALTKASRLPFAELMGHTWSEDALTRTADAAAGLGAVEEAVLELGAHIGHYKVAHGKIAALDIDPRQVGDVGVILSDLRQAVNEDYRAALSATAPDTGTSAVDTCTGAGTCTAPLHVHGCYADQDGTRCDDPGDHTAPDAGQREAQDAPTTEDLPAGVDVANVGAAAGLLLQQIALDRGAPYWHDRAGQLDAAQVWLESVADWSATLAPATPALVPPGTCPRCRHASHDSLAFCPNMASDNDCACTGSASDQAEAGR